jgi:uncharacterized protein (TIGR02246 family)
VAGHDSTPGKELTAESTAIANAMLARWVDAWNRADGIAYGDEYWPDAELVAPNGQIESSRAAIVWGHVGAWSGDLKGSQVAGTVRRIQPLGPDFLLVDLTMELILALGPPPDAGLPVPDQKPIRAYLKHLLAKRAGTWRILFAQNTFAATK